MSKITNVLFKESEHEKWAEEIYQWSYGQILRIQGLSLPTAVEIHFSLQENSGDSTRRIGVTKDGITDVVIPDTMLENEDAYGAQYSIYAFVYLTDETSGQTEYKIVIPVKTRPKPEAYDKPEDKKLFQEAIEAVNECAERAEEAESGAEAWAHGDHENYPERDEDNAKYYAERAKEDAKQTDADKKEVQSLKASVENTESHVSEDLKKSEEYANQALSAAENALQSENKAQEYSESASESLARTEASEGCAELYAAQAENNKNTVEQAKAIVMEIGQEVSENKNRVEQKVEDFENIRKKAVLDIEDAEQKAIENIGTGVDNTLTQQGKAAGAKETGNRIDKLKEDLENLGNNITITKKSKNLFDNSKIIDNTRAGLDEGSRAGCKCSQWIEVVPGTTYTLSYAGAENCAFAVAYKSADGTVSSMNKQVGPDAWHTFTAETGICAVQFGPYSVENASKITTVMLEVGATRTDYEPYYSYKAPNDIFFPDYKAAYDSIYNGQRYEEGASLVIEEMTDGKPTKFGYQIIKGGASSVDNSTIIEHGKNLYNYANDTFGKYADGTGGGSLNLRNSEFIAVEPNTDYFITGSKKSSFNIKLAEFSGNTTDGLIQVKTIKIPIIDANIKIGGVKITTSSKTKYIRISVTSDANNDFLKDYMIVKGSYGIEYEPYYEFAKYDPLHPANPWRGKRLWVDGDSITHAYERNYWQFNVAKTLDMILDTSVVGLGVEGYADGWKGIGGSTISNEAGNNDPEHSIVLRYMNYPDNGIDLIVIAAGTNDWGHGKTLLGDFDSLDDTTFNGALNILLPALKEKYPTIPVVMMTPIKRGVYKADNNLGLKLEDFVDALIVKCRQYGVYCCDMYANCPIDPNITSMQNALFTRTTADGSKDLVHPGEEGHKVMARTVTGFIRGIS